MFSTETFVLQEIFNNDIDLAYNCQCSHVVRLIHQCKSLLITSQQPRYRDLWPLFIQHMPTSLSEAMKPMHIALCLCGDNHSLTS